MSVTGSTLFAAAEPPTVPRFEWPVVRPAAQTAASSLELSHGGRRGLRHGAGVWPAAALVNTGTYVGKAVHAQRKTGNHTGNPSGA